MSRGLVWINPIKPPTNTETKITAKHKFLSCKSRSHMINKGLIFWIVKRTNKTTQVEDSAIVKSQLWKGAAPNLIQSPKKTKRYIKKLASISPASNPTTNKIEARVCVKKYLTAASEENLFFLRTSKGIKANVFNSNPSHLTNKEEDDKIKNILVKILKINNTSDGDRNIGEKV